ncbi:peptidoglycan editing factor PgeF [Butyricicoccus pullicaecorum]|nr:peptidoglycan editing factor PgeF [Butyricicoccus pullicaecorum]
MHETMRRRQSGRMAYYTCDRLPVRHAFTTKSGGVSTGDCESLNFGFNRGDDPAHVRQNYKILTDMLGVPLSRTTLTQQVHQDKVIVVEEHHAGTGLTLPMDWGADALVTALPDTPLAGFYADCVVTLLYDPTAHVCGVCHSGWRGTAQKILPKTVEKMAAALGACRETTIAVIGPSICADCFETDADVPEAMLAQMGAQAAPFISRRGAKYHVDLQGLNAMELQSAGLRAENIIVSGLCTRCQSDVFWSHRATNGRRGVQAGIICL